MIRSETLKDASAIARLIEAAFEGVPYSDGSESGIVARLRARDALSASLVFEQDGDIAGHIAFSTITINDEEVPGWFGLAPLSVAPEHQRQGMGSALAEEGLRRLQEQGARGCVVLGEPSYYARFGFVPDGRLQYPGAPAEFFSALRWGDEETTGVVAYHPAFDG